MACGCLKLALSRGHLGRALVPASLLKSGSCSVGILLGSSNFSAAVQLAFCWYLKHSVQQMPAS